MEFIKSGQKIYKIEKEIVKQDELDIINKKLKEIDAREENKIEEVKKYFKSERDKLLSQKNELNNL